MLPLAGSSRGWCANCDHPARFGPQVPAVCVDGESMATAAIPQFATILVIADYAGDMRWFRAVTSGASHEIAKYAVVCQCVADVGHIDAAPIACECGERPSARSIADVYATHPGTCLVYVD